MGLAYLAIERDEGNHEMQSNIWRTRNVDAKRVGSMVEGINEIAKTDFLFIGINASSIEDYTANFSYMRNATNIPIQCWYVRAIAHGVQFPMLI